MNLEARNSWGMAGTGIILVIVGMVVEALIPRLTEVGNFITSVGWVVIVIAVVLFIIGLVRGTFR